MDLELFSAIERGNVITQQALKRNVGVSVGLINTLLKRAIGKGLVKVRQAPYKRYAYYLTPRGFSEKSRLVAEYLESSLHLFRQARDQYVEVFQGARDRGARRVILAGRGELAEIALLAAREAEVDVREIYDRQANAGRLYRLEVLRSLDDVTDADVLVITASRRPQEMFDEVRKLCPRGQVYAPPCLRIVREPLDCRGSKAAQKGPRR